MKQKVAVSQKKRILLGVLAILLANVFVVMPVVTVVVYETVFSQRYQPVPWTEFEVSDFASLRVEECTFPSNNSQTLAGYQYDKIGQPVRGVVVLSHGLGCGGQNAMMPFADYFTSEGYLVFSYDVTGNGKSEGDSVEGLPQGVADLDYALRYVSTVSQYQNLPLFLLGHSWGAYSAGAVLNLHPDIAGAVLISGPDRSLDLMLQESNNRVGVLGYTGLPYLMLYERLKFGEYATYSVLDGVSESDAKILFVQSRDDLTVSPEIGYDKFLRQFGNDARISFHCYEDRGHDRLFYSRNAEVFREQLNADYLRYVEESGKEHGEEVKVAFFSDYPEWQRCFELDSELMEEICTLFETSIS